MASLTDTDLDILGAKDFGIETAVATYFASEPAALTVTTERRSIMGELIGFDVHTRSGHVIPCSTEADAVHVADLAAQREAEADVIPHRHVVDGEMQTAAGTTTIDDDQFSVIQTVADFAVMDRDNTDGVPTLRYWSKVEADYAASLLNAGIAADDADAATDRAMCITCGALAFAGAIDGSGRCGECQP